MIITETTPFVKLSAYTASDGEIYANASGETSEKLKKYECTPIVLRIDQIVSIHEQRNFTLVKMTNEATFLVKEGADEILELIYGDEV
jgi:hypothetical protein